MENRLVLFAHSGSFKDALEELQIDELFDAVTNDISDTVRGQCKTTPLTL